MEILTKEELGRFECKILAFSDSHFVKQDNMKILIRKDEPIYKLNELICIDYDNRKMHTSKIDKEFSDFLWVSKLHKQLASKWIVKKQCSLKYGEIPQHNYTNIDKFPTLKEFLAKNHTHYQLNTYKHKHCNYTLSVWHDQAYVISKNYSNNGYNNNNENHIKAILINESYTLQEGDMHTYVWYVNNGYFVYNSGDVFSTVVIMW